MTVWEFVVVRSAKELADKICLSGAGTIEVVDRTNVMRTLVAAARIAGIQAPAEWMEAVSELAAAGATMTRPGPKKPDHIVRKGTRIPRKMFTLEEWQRL
jgi:hypothetical protein